VKFVIKAVPCCVLAVLMAAAIPSRAADPAGVAAEVNNDKIMIADVERKVEVLKLQEPALALNTEEAKAALTSLRDAILEEMINNH
jgi:hypothetical protein